MSVSEAARRRTSIFKHPAQYMVAAFGGTAFLGAGLLMLPIATADGQGAPWYHALFVATSAVCVTGLSPVDTAVYWTVFGKGVILALIQVGGFGIMTLASLIALFVAKKVGLKTRLTAAAETKSVGPGDIKRILAGVLRITAIVEAAIALALFLRYWLGYGYPVGKAVWYGVFHAISCFNNAGFALYSDNLVGFLGDPWICLPICVGIIVGGIGFPVLNELRRRIPMHRWSLHTKLTIIMTVVLLVGGTLFIGFNEWNNPHTIGTLGTGDKVLASFFHSVQPRTAGFNSWDYGQATDGTILATIILMFIGGGSAGTAGGLKVATFLLLFFVIWAEVRGETHVNIFDRRIDPRTYRQALAVALLGLAAVFGATGLIIELTGLPLKDVLFEATSAFGTVGLSTGITSKLNVPAELIITIVMFVGRLGPSTLVSALVMREQPRHYTLPEGRPLIG